MPKISKRIVDASEIRDARYFVWDDTIKGFGLLVLPSGVKSYVYQYRTSDGTNRRATIGKHGAITAEEARDLADEMRRSVIAGGDPLSEKREHRQAATVNDVLDAYIESEIYKAKAASTKATDVGRINRHLRPLLGRQKVDSLRPGDIEKAAAAIRRGETAITEKVGPRALARVRGGDGAARKCVRLLSAIFSWAMRESLIETNPASLVRSGSDGVRETIIDDADAYGRLFKTLDIMETERRVRSQVADAVRVLALTGARRGEIAALRWRHVDLKAGLLTLPPASHKTGKRTGKPRIIGLPAAAQAIVAKQAAGSSDDYVFAPTHGVGPINLSKPWEKIRTEAGLPERIGLHGLRHSLASHMAMQGAEATAIMTAMGHRSMATSQKYIHAAQTFRQVVAEQAASVALAGMATAKGQVAEVVPLRKDHHR